MKNVKSLLIGILISISSFSLPAQPSSSALPDMREEKEVLIPIRIVDSVLVDLQRYDNCLVKLNKKDSTIQVYEGELGRRARLITTIKLQKDIYVKVVAELKAENSNKDIVIADLRKKLFWRKVGEGAILIAFIVISL